MCIHIDKYLLKWAVFVDKTREISKTSTNFRGMKATLYAFKETFTFKFLKYFLYVYECFACMQVSVYCHFTSGCWIP